MLQANQSSEQDAVPASAPPISALRVQSQHARDKGIVCSLFATNGVCPVSKCPYVHATSNTRRPTPAAVCSFYLRYRCLRDDCPFFHNSQERFDELIATGEKEYCPVDFAPARDPTVPLDASNPPIPAAEVVGARPVDMARAVSETTQRIDAISTNTSSRTSVAAAAQGPSNHGGPAAANVSRFRSMAGATTPCAPSTFPSSVSVGRHHAAGVLGTTTGLVPTSYAPAAPPQEYAHLHHHYHSHHAVHGPMTAGAPQALHSFGQPQFIPPVTHHHHHSFFVPSAAGPTATSVSHRPVETSFNYGLPHQQQGGGAGSLYQGGAGSVFQGQGMNSYPAPALGPPTPHYNGPAPAPGFVVMQLTHAHPPHQTVALPHAPNPTMPPPPGQYTQWVQAYWQSSPPAPPF